MASRDGAAYRVNNYMRRTMGFFPTSGENESPSEWATFAACVKRVTDALREARIVGSNVRYKLDELNQIAKIESQILWSEVDEIPDDTPRNTFLVNESACQAYATSVALAVMGSYDYYVEQKKKERREVQGVKRSRL